MTKIDAGILRVTRTYKAIRVLHSIAHGCYISVFVLFATKLILGSSQFSETRNLIAGILVAAPLCTEVLFELVTGQFADRRGRAVAIQFYAVCYILAATLFISAHLLSSEPASAVVWILLGVGQLSVMLGSSLLSGSAEAWLVDSLHAQHQEEDSGLSDVDDYIDKVFAKTGLLQNVGWIAGGAGGLSLVELGMGDNGSFLVLSWVVIVLVMIGVLVLAALEMPEPYRGDEGSPEEGADSEGMVSFIQTAIRQAWAERTLRYLTLAFAGGYLLWVAVAYFWPATYTEVANSEIGERTNAWNGPPIPALAFVLVGLARLFGASASVWIVAKGKNIGQSLVALTMLNTLPVALLPAVYSMWHPGETIAGATAISLLCVVFLSKMGEEGIKPLRIALLNRHIKSSKHRATIISLSTFAGAMLILVVAGLGYAVGIRPMQGDSSAGTSYTNLMAMLAAVSMVVCVFSYVATMHTDSSK